jgi:hypothetical protein
MIRKASLVGIVVLFSLVSVGFGGGKAVHITDKSCGLLDGDGNVVMTQDVKIVVTNSAQGVIIMKCKAKGVENSQGNSVQWDAFDNPFTWAQAVENPTPMLCGTMLPSGLAVTEDWHAVVSKNGNAMVTCRFQKD